MLKMIWFKNPNYLRLWSYKTATLNKTGKKNLKTHYEFRIQKKWKKGANANLTGLQTQTEVSFQISFVYRAGSAPAREGGPVKVEAH